MWKLFEVTLPGGNTRILIKRTRQECRKLYPDAVCVNEVVIV